ncbi:hypothetical protein AYO20_00143 [Fonsecaea nubica]|uniref:Uncharacterized protein n=1 Tax=Fonsecaea nubica TaxID=856822 RepID=A0A178DFF0_9EURO|nr:hypothetical protein AYO20_00143 [Fonsecaea nubica]OAL40407.1 hypothetical protein AYO20_00143 [Fonsecaea nubica]
MARTLPWADDRLPPAKKARVATASRIKHERASSPSRSDKLSAGNAHAFDRGRSPKPTPLTDPSRRAPSSSSIRGPPSTELIREGYDGDDIYIMVEDEFQTVAQSYTAHLHHAEYKRLMKQAREAAPKPLPEPTSPMSERTKRRLKSVALQNKQKDTLRRVLRDPTLEDEENEDKVVDDLWTGTSLGPLMASDSQQKKSLVGLEGISSSTKAGMGLARIQNSKDGTGNLVEEDAHVRRTSSKHDNSSRLSTLGSMEKQGTLQDGHGLAAAPTSRISHHSVREHRQPVVSGSSSERSTARKFVVDLDDDSGAIATVHDSSNGALRPKAVPQSNGKLGLKGKEQDKKSRLEEVPMFII